MTTKTRAETISPERGHTHGSFTLNAEIALAGRTANRRAPGWVNLTSAQQLALDEIELKKARILSGTGSFKEHWDDIAGYATLGGKNCV